MRPTKSDLIALLARVLPSVTPMPAGYLTEAALAGVLGLDPRRLRTFRRSEVVSPRRLGRGFVYTEAEARTCSVALALTELGLPLAAVAAFLEGGDIGEAPGGTVHERCDRLLRGLAERVESEIEELRAFQNVLVWWIDESASEAGPAAGD